MKKKMTKHGPMGAEAVRFQKVPKYRTMAAEGVECCVLWKTKKSERNDNEGGGGEVWKTHSRH